MLDAEYIRSSLSKLRQKGVSAFGSAEHRFVLNQPLSLIEVLAFEKDHSIELPADYREFILSVGNGGAGPTYGVFPLEMMDGVWSLKQWRESDGFVGILRKNFPLHTEWNDLSAYPSKDLSPYDNEFQERISAFEAEYWSSSLVDGAIPICHTGCALRIWMVVSGDLGGHLWYDKRADLGGLMPLTREDGSPLTFGAWYMDWLTQVLRDARLS